MQLRALLFLLLSLSSASAAIIGVPVSTGRYFDHSDPDAEFRINVYWSLMPSINDRSYPGGLLVYASNFPDIDHVNAGWTTSGAAFGYPSLFGSGRANINFLTNTAEVETNTLDYFSYEVIEPGKAMTLIWSNTPPREATAPDGGSTLTLLLGSLVLVRAAQRRLTPPHP